MFYFFIKKKNLSIVGFEPWPPAWKASMLTATPLYSCMLIELKINIIQLLPYTTKQEVLNIENIKEMLIRQI